MAFNLTANINARLANGGAVAAQLRKQLSANPIAVDVKLSGSATKASRQLTDSLKGLNAQLRAVSANSRSASSAINQLAASFTKFKSGTQQLTQTANAAKKIKKETQEATDQIAEFGRVSGLALRRNTGFLLATGAVYGLGRAITSSFGEAIRFEKELVKIAQVSNRSVASLKPLADEITRLSTTLGVASADLVDVSLILAQAGLSANQTRQALDALAKTTLAATFGSIQDTTEGAIALMAQFGIGAKDLGKALGATNAVAAAFAVESEDIIAAVKRAGGVFAQTSRGVTSSLGAFNEFIAVFSAVRATTRESAESIATGLRTIFTRIQRPATIQFLKELGIELTDLNGRFVGPFEAVNRLSKGLDGLDRRGSSFARVAEELGGFRQIGKTLALLSSSTQRLQALQVAQQGQNSVNKDAEQAQQSLANAIQKTKENFAALIREIAGTKTFDALVRTTLLFANALIKLADSIKPLIPLLAAFAAVKGVNIAARFLPDFKKSLGGKGFVSGGKVLGGKGGIDDIPARLTKGEYVINRKSAAMIGDKNLDNLNSIGFATGGSVGGKKFSPISNFIGSQVEIPPVEITLNVRDARGNVIEQRTTSAKTGSQAFDAIFPDQNESNTTAPIGRSARQGKLTQGEVKALKKSLGIPTGPNNTNGSLLGNANENAGLALRNRQAIAAQNIIPQATQLSPRQLRDVQLSAFSAAQGQTSPNNFSQEAINRRLENEARKERNRRFNRRQTQAQSIERSRGGRFGVTGFAQIAQPGIQDILNQDRSSRFNVTPLTEEDLFAEQNAALGGASTISSSEFSRDKKRSLRARLINAGNKSFPTIGRLGKTRVGRAVTSRLPKGSRLVAAGALAGGVIAGEKIGGTTGATITGLTGGAFTGAALGSALGPVGAGVGAAIGGIIGAFQGFIEADLDAKIKNASDNIIKSISDVETGFEGFQQAIARIGNGNIDKAIAELNNSFKGLSQNAVNSSRVDRGLTAETRDNRLSLTANEKQQAFGGFSANRRIEVLEQEKKDLEVFSNRRSDLGSAGEAAQSALNEQLSRGVDFDRAVKNLSPDTQVALAIATAKDKSAQIALGQAATTGNENLQSTARAQILGGGLRVANEEEEKRNEILAKGAKDLAKINSETDLFIARMGNLSAVLDRASLAGESLARSNEALLSRRGGGAGIRSQQRTNVFNNTAAFTQREITGEALRINAFLGNNANSREATQGVVGAKQLQTKLPAILNALSVGVRNGGESETLLPKLINQNLAGLPQILRTKLESDIRTKFFANEQASPDDVANALAGGDITDLQSSAQGVNDIFKKLVDVTNQKIGEYEQVLDTFIQLNQEANAAQDNRLQILNESANQEKALLGQQRLSVADRSRGFNTQLGQFAGRAGSGTGVQDLIARESALNSARAGSFTGAPDEVARQMANLTQSQQDSLRALELIAGNTERQNAIAEDLNSLIDSRREARQVFEDFASGSPTRRREIERNIDLARRQNDGEDFFSTRQLAGAREGQRALQAIVGATQGPDALKAIDQQQINFLDRSGASRLFGAAGVNPGVGIGGLLNNNDALFQGQFAQLQDLNRQRGAAAAGIEGINRRDANQFEQNGRDAFNSFQSNLQSSLAKGGLLDVLNNTLSNLPETIQIGGTLTHNFNFNGLEAFSAMEPAVRKLVEQHVNSEINRRMNPLTGETNPA
jgi:TP901 family phage tail tape measure protein